MSVRRCMQKKNFIYVIVAVCVLIGGLLFAINRRSNMNTTMAYETVVTSEALADKETETQLVGVYICGAVNNEGMYYLTDRQRIADVVKMAGGMKADANTKSVNLAEYVTDGLKIYIPTIDEEGNLSESEKANNGLVNINIADIQLLMTLPGIGEARAKAIVDYREKNGLYGSIEDIMQVSGIKNAAFDKIKELICV